MRLCRRKPKGQLDLGFVAPARRILCFACAHNYLYRNFAAHLLSREHRRSLARQNPLPRWRKPRTSMNSFVMRDDYEDRMWAEQEARERETEASRMLG